MSDSAKYALLIEAIKAKAAEILSKGSRLSLYGSRARGDFRADSDWDLHLLVPGEEKLPESAIDNFAWPFDRIGLDFGEIVNTRVYTFAGWLKRNCLPFYKNVERDGVIIFKN